MQSSSTFFSDKILCDNDKPYVFGHLNCNSVENSSRVAVVDQNLQMPCTVTDIETIYSTERCSEKKIQNESLPSLETVLSYSKSDQTNNICEEYLDSNEKNNTKQILLEKCTSSSTSYISDTTDSCNEICSSESEYLPSEDSKSSMPETSSTDSEISAENVCIM